MKRFTYGAVEDWRKALSIYPRYQDTLYALNFAGATPDSRPDANEERVEIEDFPKSFQPVANGYCNLVSWHYWNEKREPIRLCYNMHK